MLIEASMKNLFDPFVSFFFFSYKQSSITGNEEVESISFHRSTPFSLPCRPLSINLSLPSSSSRGVLLFPSLRRILKKAMAFPSRHQFAAAITVLLCLNSAQRLHAYTEDGSQGLHDMGGPDRNYFDDNFPQNTAQEEYFMLPFGGVGKPSGLKVDAHETDKANVNLADIVELSWILRAEKKRTYKWHGRLPRNHRAGQCCHAPNTDDSTHASRQGSPSNLEALLEIPDVNVDQPIQMKVCLCSKKIRTCRAFRTTAA